MRINTTNNGELRLTKHYDTSLSWNLLKSAVNDGLIYELLEVGDRITFNLKDDKVVSVIVAAINLYEKNSVIFVFDDLLRRHSMNNRATNNGGWAKSGMADYMEKAILPLLPKNLADIITPRMIIQNINGTEHKRESKLWLPSLTEVIGENDMTEECDFKDKQFPIFKTKKGRVKSLEDGKTWCYWLRSPYVDDSKFFWNVGNNGNNRITSANYSDGICPCFMIAKGSK